MSKAEQTKRDKVVTREIHRLFWQANFKDTKSLLLGYGTRIPAYSLIYALIPLATAKAIQSILNKDTTRTDHLGLLIVAMGVLYMLLIFIGETAIIRNAMVGSRYVQRKIFANYLAKDYDFYSNTYFGALGAKASSMRDAYNIYGEIVTATLLRQVTIVSVSITIIAFNSLLLATVTLLTMGTVLTFTIGAGAYRVRFRREVSAASSRLAAMIGDALTHATTVKSFAAESAEAQRLEIPLADWEKAQRKQWLTFVPTDMIRTALASISTAVLLVISGHLYSNGSLTITTVVLIQLYVIRLVASTLDIAQIVKTYEQVMSMAYEPVKTMLIEPVIVDDSRPKKLAKHQSYQIDFKAVTFEYPETAKDHSALKDLTISIKPGEKVGLVGYSGSGKTTLTKLMLRFMDVTSGAIFLDSIDIRSLSQASLRTTISYVPQEPLLFHRTIAENIAYARPGAKLADIQRVAKLAYVDEFIHDLPQGYDTYVGERGVKLSGGQRQRVAIARAMLKNSPILVLDEATSALDSESEKYIQEALWRLMEERTAIVIAHRLSTIQRMDRIAVMDKGAIVQLGTHGELLKDTTGIYAKLWKHQSGGYIGADN